MAREPVNAWGRRYHAFISYSHAANRQLALTVQRALQGAARSMLHRRALAIPQRPFQLPCALNADSQAAPDKYIWHLRYTVRSCETPMRCNELQHHMAGESDLELDAA